MNIGKIVSNHMNHNGLRDIDGEVVLLLKLYEDTVDYITHYIYKNNKKETIKESEIVYDKITIPDDVTNAYDDYIDIKGILDKNLVNELNPVEYLKKFYNDMITYLNLYGKYNLNGEMLIDYVTDNTTIAKKIDKKGNVLIDHDHNMGKFVYNITNDKIGIIYSYALDNKKVKGRYSVKYMKYDKEERYYKVSTSAWYSDKCILFVNEEEMGNYLIKNKYISYNDIKLLIQFSRALQDSIK